VFFKVWLETVGILVFCGGWLENRFLGPAQPCWMWTAGGGAKESALREAPRPLGTDCPNSCFHQTVFFLFEGAHESPWHMCARNSCISSTCLPSQITDLQYQIPAHYFHLGITTTQNIHNQDYHRLTTNSLSTSSSLIHSGFQALQSFLYFLHLSSYMAHKPTPSPLQC
jgi:hypothetical protein